MPPSVQSRGRGRGRSRSRTEVLTDSYNSSPFLTPTITSEVSLSESPSTTDNNRSESGFCSTSSSPKSLISSGTGVYNSHGRGRGVHLKRNVAPDDPHWTVTNLTDVQFNAIIRPKKPDELGTLGEEIQVIVNYFPILQFPHTGLVYQYNIQIRNKKNFEIHRDRRR